MVVKMQQRDGKPEIPIDDNENDGPLPDYAEGQVSNSDFPLDYWLSYLNTSMRS